MTDTNYIFGSRTFDITNIKGVAIDSLRQTFVVSFKDSTEDIDLDVFSGLEVLNLWHQLVCDKVTGRVSGGL